MANYPNRRNFLDIAWGLTYDYNPKISKWKGRVCTEEEDEIIINVFDEQLFSKSSHVKRRTKIIEEFIN